MPAMFLVISIGIHVLSFFILQKTSLHSLRLNKNPVEITIVEKNKNLKNTNARKLKNALQLQPQNAHFLGETEQIVKEETKAPNLNYLNPINSIKKLGLKDHSDSEEQEEEDLASERLRNLSGTLLNLASDNNNLDFVKEGSITSLNTDRNLYFSFYSRIGPQIYGKWVQNLGDYERHLTPNDVKRLGGRQWSTLLEVILDQDGHYKSHIVHESSGELELDLAAINSFAKVAYFPNPPKGMVKADGTVRLYYKLTINPPPARRWAKDRS